MDCDEVGNEATGCPYGEYQNKLLFLLVSSQQGKTHSLSSSSLLQVQSPWAGTLPIANQKYDVRQSS